LFDCSVPAFSIVYVLNCSAVCLPVGKAGLFSARFFQGGFFSQYPTKQQKQPIVNKFFMVEVWEN
jgi:hypothetical protein